jgi:hypothetical protein
VLDIIGACRLYLDWMSKSTGHRMLRNQLGLLLCSPSWVEAVRRWDVYEG